MSYGISMHVEPGPGIFETKLDLGDMTSNVAGMWRLASPETDGLAGIHGKTGAEVAGQLVAAVNKMKGNPDKYLLLEPDNGWATYIDALRYLGNVADAALKHPNAVFEVYR